MSESKEVNSILNKALNADYSEIEDDEGKKFLTKFNIKTITEVLRNDGKYKSIVDQNEDNENKREELRQKLFSFFEFFDVDRTGFLNACHLKKILVDSLEILTLDEFEGIFFKAEIEGGGYIDYSAFVYKIIPKPGEEQEEAQEDDDYEYGDQDAEDEEYDQFK